MKLQCIYNSKISVANIQEVARENGFTYTNDFINFIRIQ